MAKIYDSQTEQELDVILAMNKDDIAEYCAMGNMKAQETDPEIFRPNKKSGRRTTNRATRRKSAGYTVGHNKRTAEHVVKKREEISRKKMRKNGLIEVEGKYRYLDNRDMFDNIPFANNYNVMAWNKGGTVTDLRTKWQEKIARDSAEWDLTRQQMNYNGAFFRDLIRDRDDKADRIADYAYRIDAYLASEMEVQDNIFELEEQIAQLQERLTVMKNHKKTLMENRHRAEKNLDYNRVLYDMYDSVIKNQVLGIED